MFHVRSLLVRLSGGFIHWEHLCAVGYALHEFVGAHLYLRIVSFGLLCSGSVLVLVKVFRLDRTFDVDFYGPRYSERNHQ